MPKKVTKATTEAPAIEDRFRPIHELQPSLSMLVYGRSGTGKTAFGSTFPKPMLLLDVRDRGTDTIANIEGIDYMSVESWDDLEQVYWYLQRGASKYKSVVIDQISQLQDVAMSKVRQDEGLTEHDVISKRAWGQISGLLKTWLFNYRDLTDLGLHVLFIAHERTNDAEETDGEMINPNVGARLMPSVASAVNGAVNVIGCTFIREVYDEEDLNKKEIQYCMRIGPHALYTTKIRQPVGAKTPDVLVNPTFDKIMALSRGQELTKRVIKRSK